MHIILTIIMFIILICIFAAIIAFIAEMKTWGKNEHKPFGPYEKYLKRPLDAFFSTGALLTLSPVLILVAILVRIKLGAPVLFAQERPGKDGKLFKLYKFRTMTEQKDKNGRLLPDEMRLTKFGRILRATSLDELPELINILKGDMSIIGPRPLAKSYLKYYTPEERHRHDVRPGLSGLAQVSGRNNLRWEDRFKLDLRYIQHLTFLLDLKIVCLTVKKVFMREDIAQGEDAPISLSIERKNDIDT